MFLYLVFFTFKLAKQTMGVKNANENIYFNDLSNKNAQLMFSHVLEFINLFLLILIVF